MTLSAGDFPAGVTAPDEDVPALPMRPTVIGLVPRGAVAHVVWASEKERIGSFKISYAIDVDTRIYESEEALRAAFVLGSERGGVDFAALSVSSLALSYDQLRDALPRVVALLGRSRGQDVVVSKLPTMDAGAANLLNSPPQRVGVEPNSAAHYFFMWLMSRNGWTSRSVTVVPLESSVTAHQHLSELQVDTVAASSAELLTAGRAAGFQVVATSADAPHLVATVLISRGDYAARFPDALRRIVRGIVDAAAMATRDSTDIAKALGNAAPQLGDPTEAIRVSPPASLKDNVAFFGLGQEAPVTYAESFRAVVSLSAKLQGKPSPPPIRVEDTLELAPLRYVANPKGTGRVTE